MGADEAAADGAGPAEPPPILGGEHGAGTRYAGRISRHAAAYGAGSFSMALAGLASVAIFTRYLDPSEFGKMAVLTTVSMLVTLVASLTILPGTMRRVYGTGGEDVGDVDVEDMAKAVSRDPRLASSTGLALIVFTGTVLLLAGWFLREDLAGAFGSSRDGTLIFLSIGAGVAAAVMRFCQYFLRMQLRSVAYLAVSVVNAFASIAIAIPLLEDGLGIEAVVIGLIVGNAIAAAIGFVLLAPDLRLAVSLREAKEIMLGGIAYLPIILSFQTVMLADTLFVAAFASFSQTGLYRVAQKIAMPVSFGTSVFQQSWGPMRHDLTQAAVDKLDESGEYTARLLTYYAVFVSGLILTVAVLADQLVLLAAGNFGDAASLVPLTTVSVAGHGWFIFVYRNSRMKRKMHWLVGLSMLAGTLFAAAAVTLIPGLGAAGAPLAAIIAWGTATLTMMAVSQHVQRIPLEYAKLGKLLALMLVAWGISQALPDTPLGVVGELAILLAWAASLFFADVVPFAELRSLVRYGQDTFQTGSKRHLRARIEKLDGLDAELVDRVIRRRQSPEQVAEQAGMSPDEVMAHVVHALRCAAGGGEPTEADAKLGHLILVRRPRAERDVGIHMAVHEGADPIDTDLIVRAVGAAGSRRWRR
ncbi:MAG TPA: lipopolysaccharide biosynthesis protein [Solirubrobacterales bacterium]